MEKCYDDKINTEEAFKGIDDCKEEAKKEESTDQERRRRRSPGGGGGGGKGKKNMVKWDEFFEFIFYFQNLKKN